MQETIIPSQNAKPNLGVIIGNEMLARDPDVVGQPGSTHGMEERGQIDCIGSQMCSSSRRLPGSYQSCWLLLAQSDQVRLEFMLYE